MKTGNGRTRSSSSSQAGGSAGGRSNNQMVQNDSLAKNMGQQAAQAAASQFNGAPGGAAASQMTPEFLLALQNNNQFRQQAIASQQAAQLARHQSSQAHSTHSQAALAGMGLNAAAAAAAAGKAGGRVPGGNPGVAGFLPNNFPGGGLTRKFSQEQLNQQLNQISNMTSPQNTLGLQGGMPGGVSAAIPAAAAAAAMSQGMSSRVSAQMMRSNSLHGAHSMQSANPNSFARAAMVGSGMTVPEMTAMMAGSSQNASADALRAAQQGAYGNFANMGQRPVTGQRMPNPPANASAADDAFWEKLDQMKKKYAVALRRIAPITEIIADGQPAAKKDQFRKHLKDCFHILRLERSDNVSPRLTTQLLSKAERFIQSVIQVYHKLNNASREKQQQAGLMRGGVPGGSAQAQAQAQAAAAMQAKQYAAQQGSSHVSPQNQMQFMNQLQQAQAQQQMSQLPGSSSAMSAAAKAAAAKANSNRAAAAANRAAHGRVPRTQAPSAALLGGQPGMPVKPEQLAGGLPYGLPAGTPGSEQEMAMLRHRQMLAAQQQHNQHLAQSFQHPSAPPTTRAKMQSQLAQGGQALDPVALQMQQMQFMHARGGAKRPPAGVANPAAAAKHAARALAVNPLMAKQEGVAGRVVPTAAPVAAPRRAPGATLDQKIQHMQSSVKQAAERAEKLEQYVQKEMLRGKAERIQNTLAALRNASNEPVNSKKRGLGHTSLVDVENHSEVNGVIKAKTVFEASGDNGLRLAKKPKNESADIKSLKDAVEADCRSAQERNPLLSIDITEEFGQPVVMCQLLIEDIKLPKLILRVQRGYPRKGGATFGFERPPLGWVGVLDEIRTRFKRSLDNAPATSVGVAAFLDTWAREAEEVIDANLRSHLKTKAEKAECVAVELPKAKPVEAK